MCQPPRLADDDAEDPKPPRETDGLAMPTGDDLRDELASDELSLLALGVLEIPHAEVEERGLLVEVEPSLPLVVGGAAPVERLLRLPNHEEDEEPDDEGE
ncbi:hypothetical protein GCM10027396_23190 [Insolitispirillum peregrinum]